MAKKKKKQSLDGDVYMQELQPEQPTKGITYNSMKRAGKFLSVSIVMLILSLGILFGYLFVHNSTIVNKEKACWLHEQQVEQLASKYTTVNGFSSLPAYVEDIPGFDQIDSECPSGGSYTWNPVTGEYTCSEHQHYPDGFNGAQSIMQGSTTKNIDLNATE